VVVLWCWLVVLERVWHLQTPVLREGAAAAGAGDAAAAAAGGGGGGGGGGLVVVVVVVAVVVVVVLVVVVVVFSCVTYSLGISEIIHCCMTVSTEMSEQHPRETP
jgi:predicted metalloprotease